MSVLEISAEYGGRTGSRSAETVDDAEHARLMAKAEADGIHPTFAE